MLRILTLKIHQGTKFLTLIKLIFRLFDVIIFGFNGIIKQNIILGHDFQRAIFEIIAFCQIIAFPRIIAPFRCEKKIITPRYCSRKYGKLCIIFTLPSCLQIRWLRWQHPPHLWPKDEQWVPEVKTSVYLTNRWQFSQSATKLHVWMNFQVNSDLQWNRDINQPSREGKIIHFPFSFSTNREPGVTERVNHGAEL